MLARLGVTRSTIVVAYDDAGSSIAARLWWLLRWFGHGGGRVLDGGIAAWTAAGHALSIEAPILAEAPLLELVPGGAGVVDKATVDRLRVAPGAVILDARARERFEGRSEPIDARPGHIPGARSALFVENLVAPGGAFLAASALADRYRSLGALRPSRSFATAGPASPRATICWRWRSRAARMRCSTKGRGATGRGIPSCPPRWEREAPKERA